MKAHPENNMPLRSTKDLEIILSKLQNFEQPSWELEQYATPSNIAAEWVWSMALKKEVQGKVILDAACGPGTIGIGLLLLGASKVFFVDKDEKVMKICNQNYAAIKREYEIGPAVFVVKDIVDFNEVMDIVVQNPPFGTKNKHSDKLFLEKAFSVSPLVYSMHKLSTQIFVEAISRDHGFTITEVGEYDFPIKAAFTFHTKPVRKIEVGLWRMEKIK